ncbi:hypothetical protein [Streptococcus mitis]|jgi:hypothetical protein|uniref:hypothetical protein n=1 Tax=Streptococcus mitis TaxID=28037 RepID=UPI0021B783BE|nr:hypothetical protein [Streptococcus mitis]
MLSFNDLNEEAQIDFILKYYPLIFKMQQQKGNHSATAFLYKYLMVKDDKRPELYRKLLVSLASYKRYLSLIKTIYQDDLSYIGLVSAYSKLKIPKLHQTKYGKNLGYEILKRFDSDVFEKVFRSVQLSEQMNSSSEEHLKRFFENKEDNVRKITLLLDKLGLFDTVLNTLERLFKDNSKVITNFSELIDEVHKAKGHVNSDYLNSEELQINAEAFIEQFKEEVNKQSLMNEESEKEIEDGFESHLSYENIVEIGGGYVFNRKSGSIKLETSQKNRSEKQLDKYKSKKYYLASSDSN